MLLIALPCGPTTIFASLNSFNWLRGFIVWEFCSPLKKVKRRLFWVQKCWRRFMICVSFSKHICLPCVTLFAFLEQ